MEQSIKEGITMSLAFAPYGKEVEVTKINADDKTRKHLNDLGIAVGGRVTSIFDSKCDVILKVKDGRLALNRALAMKIIVQ